MAAVLLAVVVLSEAAPAWASPRSPREVSATFLEAFPFALSGCPWGIGIVYGNAPGAVAYRISYWDGYYHKVIETYVPAAQVVPPPGGIVYLSPGKPLTGAEGDNFLGVTGGNGSGPCNYSVDATENGRFAKGAKAWAIFSAPPGSTAAPSSTAGPSGYPTQDVASVLIIQTKSRSGTPHAYVLKAFNAAPDPGAKPMPLKVGEKLSIGDIVETDDNTMMAFELEVGGRVGVNTDSKVVLIDNDGTTEVREFTDSTLERQAAMWAKIAKRSEPLEIQTNGGVMGIKG